MHLNEGRHLFISWKDVFELSKIFTIDIIRLKFYIFILVRGIMVNAKAPAMNDERWTDDDDSDSYSLLGRTKLDAVEGHIISKLYGMGRKPTTIALSFRKPGHESRRLFPLLNAKEAKRAKCRLIVQGKRDASKEIENSRRILLHEVSTQHIANIADQMQKRTNTRPNDANDSSRTQPKETPDVDEEWRDENKISLTPRRCRFDRISLRKGSVLSRNEFEPSQIRITLSTSTLGNNSALQIPGRNEGSSSNDSVRRQLNMIGSKSLLGCECRSEVNSEHRRVSDAGRSLFPKPRRDSLLNTQGDVQKFRQLIREAAADEGALEERFNYCDKLTTQRVELWLRAVRRARTREGLCKQTADEFIESENHLQRQIQDKEEKLKPALIAIHDSTRPSS